jgi:DNA-binding LacI/PurR family transcriptional regulator
MAGVTIKDLARIANVHPSTVSLALADDPRLPPATRHRLQELAAKHHYRPNTAARWLRGARTGTLALVLWEESQPSRLGRVQGQLLAAVGEAMAQDYQVLVIPATRDRLTREPIDATVRRAPVDGALFMGPTLDREGLTRLVQSGLPVVHYGRRQLAGVDLPYVSADYRGGSHLAVSHLIDQGHRSISALSDPRPPTEVVQDRLEGYRDALRAAGLPVDPQFEVSYRHESAIETVSHLRAIGATALFTTTLPAALDVLHACRSQGIVVPKDLAIVAFDEEESASQADPPLTTVRQPTQEIAVGAARLLLQLVGGDDVEQEARHRLLPVELIVRRSSTRR